MPAHPLPEAALSRRGLLRRAAALAALAALPAGCRSAAVAPPGPRPLPAQLLRPPDLSAGNVLRSRVGLRPMRRGTFRIEADRGGAKPLVHNHGHGGAGWTLSWGSAVEAADRLGPPGPGQTVTVLGAGIIGLTTAAVLAERGHRVTVAARDHGTETTTSAAAGAQFAPASVAWRRTPAGEAQLQRMLAEGHRRFTATLPALRPAVLRRTNYATRPPGRIGLGHLPESISHARPVSPLPFERAGGPVDGWAYDTLCIEPPAYLRGLRRHLHARGVGFRFLDVRGGLRLADVPGDAVVQCLGLGAREAVGDDDVHPVRGQIECLNPGVGGGGGVNWMLSSAGYLFGRTDCTVVGGTYDEGDEDLAPRPSDRAATLAKAAAFFHG